MVLTQVIRTHPIENRTMRHTLILLKRTLIIFQRTLIIFQRTLIIFQRTLIIFQRTLIIFQRTLIILQYPFISRRRFITLQHLCIRLRSQYRSIIKGDEKIHRLGHKIRRYIQRHLLRKPGGITAQMLRLIILISNNALQDGFESYLNLKMAQAVTLL
jgi:hypothetical protein